MAAYSGTRSHRHRVNAQLEIHLSGSDLAGRKSPCGIDPALRAVSRRDSRDLYAGAKGTVMTSCEPNSALATPLEKLTAAVRKLGRELRVEMEEAAGDNSVPATLVPDGLVPGLRESKRAALFG